MLNNITALIFALYCRAKSFFQSMIISVNRLSSKLAVLYINNKLYRSLQLIVVCALHIIST
jgi:hypothetical protein